MSLHTVEVTTDASGDFSTVIRGVRGRFKQMRYVPDGTNPLDTGADLDVVGSKSGLVLVNQDNIGTSAYTIAPRQPTHDATGAASLYAAAGEPVEAEIYVHGEDLDFTIASGGDTLSGTFYFWFE